MIRCSYCPVVLSEDRPFPMYATCWECFMRLEYRVPTLPWWKVSP